MHFEGSLTDAFISTRPSIPTEQYWGVEVAVFSVKVGFGEASFDLRRVCSFFQAARRPLSVFIIIISRLIRKKPSPNPQTGGLMLETMQTILTNTDKPFRVDFGI